MAKICFISKKKLQKGKKLQDLKSGKVFTTLFKLIILILALQISFQLKN